MKIIGIDEEKKPRKLNRKKLIRLGIAGGILLIVLILFIIYAACQPFRDILDKYVLMKNVVEDSTANISIDESEASNVFAYNKYICVLSKNTIMNYNSLGKKEGEVNVEISNPIISTSGKYLLIAERDKNKVYLISGNDIIWEKDLEGNIDKMVVNKNGYVAVVLYGTTYKSVIQTFNAVGDELFKTYLSSTTVMDLDISMDNQYLAFAEVNTSGTIAQSTIKTVSISKAKQKDKKDENPITNTYSNTEGNLIINVKYQEGNKLVCMFDNGIFIIKKDEAEQFISFNEDGAKVSFADVELNSCAYRIVEKSSLVNTQTSLEIINSGSTKASVYSFDGVSKECYSYEDTIALNVGSEVHFISTNGWLIKKYLSTQEVKKVVMCNSFAGIVYRNKIEIVNI